MNKTKIEWVRNADGTQGYSWNPIKGLCPVGCWYCYARKMYKRFKWDEKIDFLISEKDVIQMMIIEPARIFVCSTMEMFHPNIPSHLRDSIFYIIEKNPRHTFIILTKMPENIDRPMPDNTWLGVSVSRREEQWRIDRLHETRARVRFVSLEPLFEDDITVPNGLFFGIDWVVVGRLTGHGYKMNPSRLAVDNIIKTARHWNIPIFLKNNLREIWGSPLIQEFPK